MPMYDEYEEEHLQNILDELDVETKPTNERNQDAMQSQKVEVGKDDKGTGGDSLPLCYASFELIRHMIKASKQKKKKQRWRRPEAYVRMKKIRRTSQVIPLMLLIYWKSIVKGQAMKTDVAASK